MSVDNCSLALIYGRRDVTWNGDAVDGCSKGSVCACGVRGVSSWCVVCEYASVWEQRGFNCSLACSCREMYSLQADTVAAKAGCRLWTISNDSANALAHW